MITYTRKTGSTDVSCAIRIIDATDGSPETGVAWNTSGIDLWYRREGEAPVDLTEASLSALTDAHADGGFLAINDGWYRVDLPDAALADGAEGVLVGGTVTGMIVIGSYIELVSYDPFDLILEIADGLLDRDLALGADSGSATVRTVRQALRLLRNKHSTLAGTLSVMKEDDVTESWSAALTTSGAAEPIVTVDPASS